MIAMLGGLGAAGELSPAARAAGNAITFAKTVEELSAISAGLPNMGLPKNEELILKVMIDKKVEEITNPTPFYKRPGYWLVVAGLAAAWWHRDKIKSWFDRGSLRGLSGVTEFDSAMNDANEAFREAQKSSLRGRDREAMGMVQLAESYIADAKREAGSDAFRKSLAESLAARVKDLRKEVSMVLRPGYSGRGKLVPAELQTISYGGDSIAARRGFK